MTMFFFCFHFQCFAEVALIVIFIFAIARAALCTLTNILYSAGGNKPSSIKSINGIRGIVMLPW